MRHGGRTIGVALVLAALAAPRAARAICPSLLAGTCWVSDGSTVRGVGSASAYGRSVECTLRCAAAGGDVLILRDDGTYSAPAPAPTVTCPQGGEVPVPDEEGFVRAKGRKLILEPGNVAALDAAFDACAGRDMVIRRYRTTIRIAPDGGTLSGTSRLRIVTRGRVPITTSITQRFTATRAVTARPALRSAAQSRARELPVCSASLEPRCVTD